MRAQEYLFSPDSEESLCKRTVQHQLMVKPQRRILGTLWTWKTKYKNLPLSWHQSNERLNFPEIESQLETWNQKSLIYWDQTHTRLISEQLRGISHDWFTANIIYILLLLSCVMGLIILQHLSLEYSRVHGLFKNVFCPTEERRQMRSSLWLSALYRHKHQDIVWTETQDESRTPSAMFTHWSKHSHQSERSLSSRSGKS